MHAGVRVCLSTEEQTNPLKYMIQPSLTRRDPLDLSSHIQVARDLKKPMNLNYSEDQILYFDGKAAMENNDLVRASASLKKSAEIYPHFKTLESIGECLLEQGNFRESVIYLSASAGLGNKQFRSYFLLAKALIELKDIELARDKLNQALFINPNYKAAKDLLSTISGNAE